MKRYGPLAFYIGLALLVSLTTVLTPGCHAPVSVTTPQGKVAYTADQIAIRIGELQNAAIQANASNGLSTDTTRIIVQFSVDANRVLAATPSGWQATVAQLWTATKNRLGPGIFTNTAIAAAVSAVDTVLAAFGS
jgi:hypothetical protein